MVGVFLKWNLLSIWKYSGDVWVQSLFPNSSLREHKISINNAMNPSFEMNGIMHWIPKCVSNRKGANLIKKRGSLFTYLGRSITSVCLKPLFPLLACFFSKNSSSPTQPRGLDGTISHPNSSLYTPQVQPAGDLGYITLLLIGIMHEAGNDSSQTTWHKALAPVVLTLNSESSCFHFWSEP